jgi:hypothetical protein
MQKSSKIKCPAIYAVFAFHHLQSDQCSNFQAVHCGLMGRWQEADGVDGHVAIRTQGLHVPLSDW